MRGEERTCRKRRGKPTMAELACDFFTNGAPLGRSPLASISAPPVLGEALLQSIATRGGVKRYPAHAVIITEGDTSDQLFIILTGRVKVYTGNEEGKELVIAVHGPGEYIGELALDRG